MDVSNEACHNYYGPRDTVDILKVIGSKVKARDNIFRKRTFPMDAYTDLDHPWMHIERNH